MPTSMTPTPRKLPVSGPMLLLLDKAVMTLNTVVCSSSLVVLKCKTG